MDAIGTDHVVRAALLGLFFRDSFADEFGRTPGTAGPETVGDWDSTAWSDAWNRLAREGATDGDYDPCLAAWRQTFWSRPPSVPDSAD